MANGYSVGFGGMREKMNFSQPHVTGMMEWDGNLSFLKFPQAKSLEDILTAMQLLGIEAYEVREGDSSFGETICIAPIIAQTRAAEEAESQAHDAKQEARVAAINALPKDFGMVDELHVGNQTITFTAERGDAEYRPGWSRQIRGGDITLTAWVDGKDIPFRLYEYFGRSGTVQSAKLRKDLKVRAETEIDKDMAVALLTRLRNFQRNAIDNALAAQKPKS